MEQKEKVILAVFKCFCKNCSNEFDTYDFSDFFYGQRLIRTKDGNNFSLVKCIEDKVFNEISEINDLFFKNKNIPDTVKYKCFDKVFGLSCDPIDGRELDFTVGVICPNCRSKEVDRTEYTPKKTIEMFVNLVSHCRWDRMNNNEKKNLIFSTLLTCFVCRSKE